MTNIVYFMADIVLIFFLAMLPILFTLMVLHAVTAGTFTEKMFLWFDRKFNGE